MAAKGQQRSERVEIGFGGGQVVVARLSDAKLKELRKALGSTDKHASEAARWYELDSEDGTVSLDLRQVVFVRVASAEHRIGFTGT
jgi:hypothetical protein